MFSPGPRHSGGAHGGHWSGAVPGGDEDDDSPDRFPNEHLYADDARFLGVLRAVDLSCLKPEGIRVHRYQRRAIAYAFYVIPSGVARCAVQSRDLSRPTPKQERSLGYAALSRGSGRDDGEKRHMQIAWSPARRQERAAAPLPAKPWIVVLDLDHVEALPGEARKLPRQDALVFADRPQVGLAALR